MKFNTNIYNVIGDGLEPTIKLFKEILSVMSREDSPDVQVWPFEDMNRGQIAYSGIFLRGTESDVNLVMSMVDEKFAIQPVIL